MTRDDDLNRAREAGERLAELRRRTAQVAPASPPSDLGEALADALYAADGGATPPLDGRRLKRALAEALESPEEGPDAA